MSDYEEPAACVVTTPTARKPHRCCECRGTIRAGEKYELTKGVWDHQGQTFKTCADCAALRKVVHRGYGEDWYYGGLAENIASIGDAELCARFDAIKAKRRKGGAT